MVELERDSVLEKALFDTGANMEWSFLISLYYTVQTATTIGFGDIYVHSPGHALLNIAPVISTMVTAFCIALFAKLLGKIQEGMEKKAGKKTDKLAAVHLGVIRVNRTATKENNKEDIKQENISEVEI